jgi:CTP:molybdopterin cytidylyltransferase MocA
MSHLEPGTGNSEQAAYALVLAAGSGSRFGGDKLLALLHGHPLISYTARAVAEAIAAGTLAGGVAVIPPAAPELLRALDSAGLRVVENPEAGLGMATSLRLGLAALDELTAPPAGGAVVVLADQPAVRAEVIARLVEGWRQSGRSTRPRYLATPAEPGHPVLLDRSLWHLAGGLTGDTGLRVLLAGEPVTLMDVPGANPDVDTPADLRRLEDSR